MSSPESRRPRAVLLVANPAAPYSRGLRVARSLAEAGFEVEIAATTGDDQPIAERDGEIAIKRYAPSRPFRRWSVARQRPSGAVGRLGRLRRLDRFFDLAIKVLLWPLHARAWWATLRRDLPPADLYHAFGILTIPVAIALAHDARRQGRAGRVVYDVIDVILDSNNYANLPRPVLAFYRWRERRWVREADAVVTVNEQIADHLERIWPLGTRPTVLLNCQPRWTPPNPRSGLIREAIGLPAGCRIVLFLGRLGRERGLDVAADAVLSLEDAALVLLGFGPWAQQLRDRDRDPRYAGRHFTLPAVHPDDVPAWTASADVSIVAVPANSLNQRLSTPNKFWESLTAGTPVVVGRDLVVMREIVERERLGTIADPEDTRDLARALRDVLDQPSAEFQALRDRCLAVTRERYNWEAAVEPYLAVARGLVAWDHPAGPQPATDRAATDS